VLVHDGFKLFTCSSLFLPAPDKQKRAHDVPQLPRNLAPAAHYMMHSTPALTALAAELMEAEFVQSFGSAAQLFFLASSGYLTANLASLQALHSKWAAPELLSTLRHPFGLTVLGRLLASEKLRERLKDQQFCGAWALQLAAFAADGAPLPA